MEYKVECYEKTGFNSVNIPESLEWLRKNFKPKTFPGFQVFQNEGLSSVSVNAKWENIKDVDYIVIGDECYAVIGPPQMTSTDVATLAIAPDEITSCGGAEKQIYLDGLTDRHTVASDKMFRYDQEDPLTAPSQPLQLVVGDMLFSGTETTHVPVESTVDLVKLGKQFDDKGNFNGKGMTFTDDYSGETVTVPRIEGVGARTQYVIHFEGDAKVTVLSPNTRLYETIPGDTYPKINNALAGIRALGTESALISQIAYPDEFVDCQVGTDGQYSFVQGKDQTAAVDSTKTPGGMKFKYSTTVKNSRLFYGEYNKYGLISAAGSKGEYLPEQIKDKDTDEVPSVRCIADPRPDGKPYFRYSRYAGDSTKNGFFMGAIPGLEWQNVPLTYDSPSGTYMNQVNFTNSSKISQNAFQYGQKMGMADVAHGFEQGVMGVAKSAAGMATLKPDKLLGSQIDMVQGVIDTAYSTATGIAGLVHNNTVYGLQRQQELAQYTVSQTVSAPDVLFPFNANVIRDFIGNGVIPYRYRYTDADLVRIDKILTMYGYKDSTALIGSLFHCRKNFDYVSASGVSIGGDIAAWKKEIMCQQLGAGVRVWHVKPNVKYYTDNPVLTAEDKKNG